MEAEMTMKQKDALRRAINIAGGQIALGKEIGAGQTKVSFWLNGSKKGVAAGYVLPIEKATGVSRHDLRPDIYPRESSAVPKKRSGSSGSGGPSENGAPRGADHFSRFKHVRQERYKSAEEIESYIRALRDEWSHR
jgi:DNA-binding transcriptional regulator YdaS (Cro superfamily)